MKTSINGVPAEWDERIYGLWLLKQAAMPHKSGEVVTSANYFTPRPYVDEWNRGSREEGFTYVINGERVCWIRWCP